jgi:AAA15 family ATPase/GTPase
MFKKITLKNYRTHIDTTLELQEITLLMGGNNAGKSNLLTGIQDFSKLVSHVSPKSAKNNTIGKHNYYPHKHCLDTSNKPLVFACEWENSMGNVAYQIALYTLKGGKIGCQEQIEIDTDNNPKKRQEHGYAEVSNEMLLRTQLEKANLLEVEKRLLESFFHALASVYYYHNPVF